MFFIIIVIMMINHLFICHHGYIIINKSNTEGATKTCEPVRLLFNILRILKKISNYPIIFGFILNIRIIKCFLSRTGSIDSMECCMNRKFIFFLTT